MDLSAGGYETGADVCALLCAALLLSILHRGGWAVLLLLPVWGTYVVGSQVVVPFLLPLLLGGGGVGKEGKEGKDRAGDRRKAKERDAKQKQRR